MPKEAVQTACSYEKGCYSKTLTPTRGHCSACHEYFNSDAAFDKHRVGRPDDPKNPRRCLSVSEMVKAGMGLNDAGFWVTKAFDAVGKW